MKVTALESFVQCPFQFFSRHTLKLEPPPPRPTDRLDFRVQGAIVHKVIAQFLRTREPIDRLFAAAFDEACREHNLVRGYRTESLRAQMREDLLRFAADGKWPITAGTSAEESFEFQLAPDITLRGRIDRMERTAAGDASVFDYKYSKKARDYARDEGDLQGPLYLIAVEKAFGLRPTAMHYCGLRGEVRYIQQDTPPGRIAAALETAIQAAARIRAGDVTVDPADADKCRYCESRDICRYAAGARVAVTAPTGA